TLSLNFIRSNFAETCSWIQRMSYLLRRGSRALLRGSWHMAAVSFLLAATSHAANPSATLSQGANGRFGAPVSPVTWQNGNMNENNSHYLEGQSVPYRLVMTGLTNGPHVVIIEWDIKNSDRDAIDYLTSCHRIVETVDPLSGLNGTFGPPVSVLIPPPVPSL